MSADVVDAVGNVNLDNFTLDGRLYCETNQNSCSVVSNATIDSPQYIAGTPEPSSFILLGSGAAMFGAFAVMNRRKRKLAVAK